MATIPLQPVSWVLDSTAKTLTLILRDVARDDDADPVSYASQSVVTITVTASVLTFTSAATGEPITDTAVENVAKDRAKPIAPTEEVAR